MPHSLKANNGSMFAPKTPHFFKIILEATIRDKKLGIPRKFVKKYGKGLSSSVLLTVPSGDTWHAQLTKSDGVVWFQNGWQAFAEYYSLQYGHFLVFRYEGNGKFLVLIFDMSASEIEYPCKSHIEDHNSDDQVCLKLVKKEAKDDTCDGTLYETPPCKETRKKKKKKKRSRPPCSKPRKKLKTTQKDKNEKDWEDESTREEDMQTKVPRDEHAFGVIEYDKALQRASSFRSENPFFLVIMQPSYINPGRKMCIPKEFTMKFLKENLGDLTLCTSEGKTWSTQYWRYISRNKYTKAIIHIGWRQFMLANNLEAGDVCVFELISQTESMLKVIIYRVRQDTSCSSPLGGINSSENGGNINSSTLGSTESNHDCLMRPMTPVEKARAILKASNFKSKNPFFKVVMRPRYLILRCSLGIPYKFVKRYLDEEKEEAILQVSDGRTWVVKFAVKVFTGGQHKAEFSTWRAFARDNNLEVGDVCVFELINRHENSFKVSIFSAAPGANSSLSSQADDAEASQVASKNCLVPRIEADDDFGNCYAGNSGPAAQLTTIEYQENEEEVNLTDDAIASQVASKDWLVPKIEADDDFGKCHVGNSSPAAQFPAIGYQETEEEVQPTISTRPRGPQRLQAGEKAKALQRASGFKSQNPFFTVAMQPSYVSNGYRLAIPLDFSRKYLRNGSGNAILSMVGDGKTWLTKYHREAKGTNPRAKLIDGWKTFAKDNNLEIGDVCVFEMINSEGYQLSLNVAIYKPHEDQT
ncbi:hypothetical protein V6Z11_A12G077200 [Gossypium hirsutum]|uniref:B3 domain-containing protein Os03g0620400 n=1 Tax=Gossypium hirsutum TaxID=3635 RepID=A0ABM2ZBE6_GOSHI|nr:B3 domain-containing protein Os03g0620400-like [Gossypium hirsutum]